MDEQQPVQSAPAPIVEKHHLRRPFAIALAVVSVLAALEAYAFHAQIWPHSSEPTPTPTPVPVVQATPTPDPTAGWKTYANTRYGYTLRYPSEATPLSITDLGSEAPIVNTSPVVYIWLGDESPNVIFSVTVQTGTLSMNWIKQKFSTTNPSQVNPVAFTVAGKAGYKVAKNATFVSDRYVVQDGASILTFVVSNATADLILSTFKFTNSTGASCVSEGGGIKWDTKTQSYPSKCCTGLVLADLRSKPSCPADGGVTAGCGGVSLGDTSYCLKAGCYYEAVECSGDSSTCAKKLVCN